MQVSVLWGASKDNREFVWSKSMQEVWDFGHQEMGQSLTDEVQASTVQQALVSNTEKIKPSEWGTVVKGVCTSNIAPKKVGKS